MLARGAGALAEAQHIPVVYDPGSIVLAQPWAGRTHGATVVGTWVTTS
jgi:hypothetical protein